MNEPQEVYNIRRIVAILRITLGVIILVTWFNNLQKGVYTAAGIQGLFDYIFYENQGGFPFFRSLVEASVMQAPGAFAVFFMIAELLMGLGLLFGALTPIAGAGATVFFFNLFLAYFGGSEWIWTYVLLMVAALVVFVTRSGRALGIDQVLLSKRGLPPGGLLW